MQDDGGNSQARLLVAVDRWIDDISFHVADEPTTDSNRLLAWKSLEQVLASLDEHHLLILITKQRNLCDIMIQHISVSAFRADQEVWVAAVECLSHCLKLAASAVWDACESDRTDLEFLLSDVVSDILQRGPETLRRYALQAMELWHQANSEAAVNEAFQDALVMLLSGLANSTLLHRRVNNLVMRMLFPLASNAREQLLNVSNEPQRSSLIHLPLGGSGRLLTSLCTHKSIVNYPLVVLTIIKCHAALCSVHIPANVIETVGGMSEQHSIITNFLVHLQLCIADKSMSLAAPVGLQSGLLIALVPLMCGENNVVRFAARALAHVIMTGRTQYSDTALNSGSHMTMNQVVANSSTFLQYGVTILDGWEKVLMDLSGQDLTDCNEDDCPSLCNAVDEMLEVLLEYTIPYSVAHDPAVAPTAQKLAQVLTAASQLTRPKMAVSLLRVLQRGANCNVRGCSQLLEANVAFSGSQRVSSVNAPPQSGVVQKEGCVAHTMHGSSVGKAPDVIDLTRDTSSDGGLSGNHEVHKAHAKADTLAPPQPDWAFLMKPSTASTAPAASAKTKAPNSATANTTTTTSKTVKDSAPSKKESAFERLAREEQEALAAEKRNLIRKRIFGDIDAHPPPNSDDLMGPVGKYARMSAEFAANVGWLDARRGTGSSSSSSSSSSAEKETSWEQQSRELREQKERARRQFELQRQAEGGNKPHPGESASAGGVVSEHPVRRPGGDRRVRFAESSLLSAGDTGEDAAEQRKPVDWRTLLQLTDTPTVAAAPTAKPAVSVDVSALLQQYMDGQLGSTSRSARSKPTIAEAMSAISIDPLIRKLLKCDFATICADSRNNRRGGDGATVALEPVPVRFLEEEHYIGCFIPLLLEEVKAAVSSCINGETSADDTRTSSALRRESGSPSVRVRCVLKNARIGQPKLQEAHVVPVADTGVQQGKLMKDDLVLVMESSGHLDTANVQQLVGRPHALALVLTAPAHTETAAGERGRDDSKESRRRQQTLLMLAGTALPQDTVRVAVPVMSLTTFLREWSALMSIRNHHLMPLAPYLLKGSPVVSSQHLSALHDSLIGKLKSLECQSGYAMSMDRQARLNASLLEDLQAISQLYVDGSVLKNTGIAKTIKTVTSAKSKLIASQCETLAAEIIQKWKEQVKNDNKVSTIRNMKGGKVIEMPAGDSIERPRCVAAGMWSVFERSYNKSQLFAIKFVSDQFEGGQDTRIALVQGPPGTGKTFTVLGMVAALLSHHSDGEPSTRQRRRLLICAPSNTAVDELLNRISGGVLDASGAIRKVRMVRLGEPQESASQAIQAITLDAQIEVRLKSEDSWVKLCTAKEQISRLDRELAGLPISKFSQAASTDSSIPAGSKEQQRARSLRSELATARQVKLWAEMAVERTRNQLRQQILLEADIVGATLSGSGRKQFLDLALQHDVTFDTTIIDEAAQATEPSCLIPLRLGCRRLVLVGDPRQLPATVLSNAAAHAGLGRSLFERLERADHEVVMLTVQYRMHPEIRQFPSLHFYQNLLTDAPVAQSLSRVSLQRGNQHSTLAAVRFLDLRLTTDSMVGKSFANDAEVSVISRILAALLPHTWALSVAVIAPYKAQVNAIKRALRDDSRLAELQQERRRDDAEIEVNSVDGFQGREKDIVIFSAVRSNMRHAHDALPGDRTDGTDAASSISETNSNSSSGGRGGGSSIGFVADERRLNVAITRAKRLLIVVGNAGTLATDLTWRAMIQNLHQRHMVSKVARLDELRSDASVLDLLVKN